MTLKLCIGAHSVLHTLLRILSIHKYLFMYIFEGQMVIYKMGILRRTYIFIRKRDQRPKASNLREGTCWRSNRCLRCLDGDKAFCQCKASTDSWDLPCGQMVH